MTEFEQLINNMKRFKENPTSWIPLRYAALGKQVGITRRMYHLIGGDPGTGKCLAKGTKVIMFNGSLKKVEDIKPGDLLMGVDSTPRKVSSTTSGIQQMYIIKQKNGINYKVNADHLVALRYNKKGKRQFEINTFKAEDLYNNNQSSFFHYNKGFKTSVDFKEKEVNVDPYLIGLWLGDGSSSKPEITTNDQEIKKYLIDRCNKYGFYPTINSTNNSSVTISLTKQGKRVRNIQKDEIFNSLQEALKTIDNKDATNISRSCIDGTKCGGYNWEYVEENFIYEELNNLNLYNNKHIPDKYLYNSRKNRLKLLAGLVDSDGTKNKNNNCYSISTIKLDLAKQITYLCRSLGFRTSLSTKIADIKLPNNKILKDYKSYIVRFTGTKDIPCLVERKKPGIRRVDENLHTEISVEKDEIDEYYGFTLEGKDKYFLLEDFTVTHNTSFVDQTYVLDAHGWSYRNPDKAKLKTLYFSMERSKEYKKAKWLAHRMYTENNIIIGVPTLLSWGTGHELSDEMIEISKTHQTFFDRLFGDILIHDGITNPTGKLLIKQ